VRRGLARHAGDHVMPPPFARSHTIRHFPTRTLFSLLPRTPRASLHCLWAPLPACSLPPVSQVSVHSERLNSEDLLEPGLPWDAGTVSLMAAAPGRGSRGTSQAATHTARSLAKVYTANSLAVDMAHMVRRSELAFASSLFESFCCGETASPP